MKYSWLIKMDIILDQYLFHDFNIKLYICQMKLSGSYIITFVYHENIFKKRI